MARLVKCKFCNNDDKRPATEMIKEKQGYFHPECHKQFVKIQEYKDREVKELDELYVLVKEIHGLVVIPSEYFSWVQRLRNGSIVEKGRIIKKYKEGVRYSVIKQAYMLSKRDIEIAKRTKDFQSDMSELIYGFKIMHGKLNDAYNRQKKQKREEEMRKSTMDEHKMVENDIQYKPKKDENDISDFLD